MTAVSLDPADYAEAAANFNSIKSSAVLRGLTLGRELGRYDNMAGTDDGGQAFAVEYDANAGSMVQALDYIAIRASEFDAGLTATASSHYLADQAAAGNVAAASIYTPRDVFTGSRPATPPSAFGGDPTPPPEPWNTVRDFIGMMFPDANTDRLREAATTWSQISEHLDEVAAEIKLADNPLIGTRSAEIDAIQQKVIEFSDIVTQIAADALEVSGQCDDYATQVEAAREETWALLRQLAIEIAAGIGIGVALSFFTFGAAGAVAGGALAVRIAAVASRITQTILKVSSIARKAAQAFAGVHGRVVAAVARLSPRGQTFVRVGNQVVGDTTASVFAEGVVRGDDANYLSAFAGGFVGAGTTAGVLSIFGRRADALIPNVLAGGAGGFTGSVASGAVTGNLSAQDLVFGTVFGTAGGALGSGGGSRTPSGSAPTTSGGSGPGGSSPLGGSKPPGGGADFPPSDFGDFPSGAVDGGDAPSGPAVGDSPTSSTPSSTAPVSNAVPPSTIAPPANVELDLTPQVRPGGDDGPDAPATTQDVETPPQDGDGTARDGDGEPTDPDAASDVDVADGTDGATPPVDQPDPLSEPHADPSVDPAVTDAPVADPFDLGPRKIDDELYDRLRGLTPDSAAQVQVNAGHVIGSPDIALPGKTVDGPLQADHIVAMDKIARMDGFDQLSEADQVTVLNHPANFAGLSPSANASKGSKSYAEWTTYVKEGLPINPAFRETMMARELELLDELQTLIRTLAGG